MIKNVKTIEGKLVGLGRNEAGLCLEVERKDYDNLVLFGNVEENCKSASVDSLELGENLHIDYYLFERHTTGLNVDLNEYRFIGIRKI